MARIELVLWNKDVTNNEGSSVSTPIAGPLRVQRTANDLPVAVDAENQGARAFQPDVLGHTVTVVRTIKDNGQTTLKVLSANGEASKRGTDPDIELRDGSSD